MQEAITANYSSNNFKIDDLPLEDKQRLIGAFAWLIQEDKKQNPELYKPKKKQSND